MKIKRQKKGFTIVELVIVIAVIGILAAVLIPTFVGLVRKANIAADTALVKDLNTVLATDKALNGKHTTMYDALEATKESGLDVSKINAKVAKNEILWDSANDVFCYLDDGEIKYVPDTELEVKAKNVKAYQYFVIRDVDSADDISADYSTYLRSSSLAEILTTKGFDAGEVTTITKVTYTNSGDEQNVVIRTNGGELVVNAPNDTVVHYGTANVVDVNAIAGQSYHEFGKVAFIKLQQGHIVVENNAYVEVIYKTSSTATVEKSISAVINSAIADNDSNKSNGSHTLVFNTSDKSESDLKTESKKNLEYHVMTEAGYIAKAGSVYYKTISEALSNAYTVYLIADSDENVTLNSSAKSLIVEKGVNYTGNVKGATTDIEVVADLEVYVGSFDRALVLLDYFSPTTKAVTIKLLDNMSFAKQQMITAKSTTLTLDLNGKTITSTLGAYQFLFQIKDDFNITSSVAGAKIELGSSGLAQLSGDYPNSVVNISNVEINKSEKSDKELILNYATVNIENSTINVVGKGKVFNLYGDLTLGEGVVVNVSDVLGSSFIGTNGTVNVVIDGAEINIDEFKVYGGGLFSLSAASSLKIKDSELNVGVNETYSSKLVYNPQNATVEIENLTTDIKGVTAGIATGTTYTVDASTATWSKN